jgi:hypothetical protein
MAHESTMTDIKTPQDQLDVVPANDNIVHDAEGLKRAEEPEVTWTEEIRGQEVRHLLSIDASFDANSYDQARLLFDAPAHRRILRFAARPQ